MADQVADSDRIASTDANASDPDVRMVLRTVYLPPSVDDELRVRAFRSNQTKNDLIREAVTRWLSDKAAGVQPSAKVETRRAAAPSRRAARKGAVGKA